MFYFLTVKWLHGAVCVLRRNLFTEFSELWDNLLSISSVLSKKLRRQLKNALCRYLFACASMTGHSHRCNPSCNPNRSKSETLLCRRKSFAPTKLYERHWFSAFSDKPFFCFYSCLRKICHFVRSYTHFLYLCDILQKNFCDICFDREPTKMRLKNFYIITSSICIYMKFFYMFIYVNVEATVIISIFS